MASKKIDIVIPEGYKYCFGCETLKPHHEFNKHRNRKDGCATQCKNCVKQRHKRHTNENNWIWRHRRNRYLRQYGESPTWQELEELWDTSGGRCWYCHTEIPREKLEFDHRIPVSRGGRTEKQNMVVACKPCNRLKGEMAEQEFQEFLIEYIARFQCLMGNRAEAI